MPEAEFISSIALHAEIKATKETIFML